MSIPAWILDTFAAVMILVAEVSAGLLLATARARTGRADAGIAVSWLLTGIALVGILVPALSTLPSTAWAVVFAVTTAWFAWSLWRESRGGGALALAAGRLAPALVCSAAMLYLFAALGTQPAAASGMSMSGMGAMPGMTNGSSSGGLPVLHVPTLAILCVLLLIAGTVRDLDRRAGPDGAYRGAGRPLVPAGSAPRATSAVYTAERLLLSPAVAKGCQVATGVTIAFTLLILI